jgi:hypothetical protein
VAQKEGGVLTLETSKQPPAVVSTIPPSRFRQQDAMSITAQGRYLYVALGDHFAAQGAHAGLAKVDVMDPAHPRVVSIWTSPEKLSGSACVEVQGNYAYLGAMREGLFILDISDDAKDIRLISTFQPDIHFPVRSPNRVQHPNARGIAIHNHLLYLAYDAGGLRVIDIADPRTPREIGRYINPDMGRWPRAYNNVVLSPPYAYVAVDYAGLEILDIRDPRAIRRVGWWNPWNAGTNANNWFNSPGHTNQLALDTRDRRVYLSAGDSELQVVNVSNPRKPFLEAFHGEQKDRRGVWGLTLTDDLALLSYIKTAIPFQGEWSGIRAVPRLSSNGLTAPYRVCIK